MNDVERLRKIGFKISEDGKEETLWAFPVGNNIYCLDNSPFFAYGVSWKDIVQAEPDENGFPFFSGIIEKSGHRTVRVLLEKDSHQVDDLIAKILELGCTCETAFSRILAVDIPPHVEMQTVTDYLTSTNLQWEYADPTYEEIINRAG